MPIELSIGKNRGYTLLDKKIDPFREPLFGLVEPPLNDFLRKPLGELEDTAFHARLDILDFVLGLDLGPHFDEPLEMSLEVVLKLLRAAITKHRVLTFCSMERGTPSPPEVGR